MKKENNPLKITSAKLPQNQKLFDDLRQMIEDMRLSVAVAVNTGLTMLYWKIGKRINEEIIRDKRAAYGEEILATLSQELTALYGRGFSYSALTRMCNFAGVFPDDAIVATLSRQLSWSHFMLLIPIENSLQREFYAEMCRVERWSVRTLRKKIDSMLFERTALSKKPEALAHMELSTQNKNVRFSAK